MKQETLARVTVVWPEEDETYFWAELLLGDVDKGPTTRIPDEGDVIGELVTWVNTQGHQSFLIEVWRTDLDEAAMFTYHDGVWTNSDGVVCEYGPSELPISR